MHLNDPQSRYQVLLEKAEKEKEEKERLRVKNKLTDSVLLMVDYFFEYWQSGNKTEEDLSKKLEFYNGEWHKKLKLFSRQIDFDSNSDAFMKMITSRLQEIGTVSKN